MCIRDSRHVVFSIPKRLRPYFRYSRKLVDILFKVASKSLAECLSVGEEELALILTLQTAGEALNWNPHLHGILADGTFLPDGNFNTFREINVAAIQNRFTELVLSAFTMKELITDELMNQLLSQEYTGFSVWVGDAFEDKDSEHFLQAMFLTPMNLSRGTTDGTPAGQEENVKNLRSTTEPEPLLEVKNKPSSSWARCISQVYEVDPLECPKCKEQMRIISFIHDSVERRKINLARKV